MHFRKLSSKGNKRPHNTRDKKIQKSLVPKVMYAQLYIESLLHIKFHAIRFSGDEKRGPTGKRTDIPFATSFYKEAETHQTSKYLVSLPGIEPTTSRMQSN